MYIHCTGQKGDLYCLWKETVFKVVFSCAVCLELKLIGGPGYFLLMSDILVRINGYNIVGYFIKHRDSGSHTCLFESLLIQVAFHVGYAACVMVSTRYKACYSPLYSFREDILETPGAL